MDLERIKKRNALFDRGAKLIEQARKLDVEGNYVDALPTYTEAIETLFQTLQYVSDGEDKKQLRTLIEQFLSRAEEIKAVFAQQQEMLQHYQQQRTSVDLTASTLQQLQLDNRGSVNMGNNNSSNASNSEVMSAVQQLEAIQVPAELPNKKVLGRLARTSVALPGTSQSMTPVNVTPNNSALPGQVSHNSPAANNNNYHAANNYGVNNSSITNGVGNNYGAHNYNVNNHSATNNYTPDHSYQVPNTNPWASAVTSPTHHYATQQLNSPYHNTASNNTYNNTSAYNNVSPYTPASPHTPNAYHNNTSAAYGTPASPYTAPYTSPTQQHYTSPRTSQHYSSPISGSYSPYNPTPYIPAPYSPAPSVDQYGNPYPRLYPSDAHSAVPQPQYHSAAQPYSPHSAQSYYDPHQSYTMQHSAYPDSCYTPQPNNPWGNYATSSCDPCDPCTGNYQYTQGMPPMNVSMTPVNVSQVQYSPVMSNTAVQSWPQHYTTQFTDLNQFINTNNLTAAVPQPDKDREKIILYFMSKGFQRQHVESSYDYLRKMNLQVNADFVEILKDALLVYPTTGTAGTAGTTSGTATPAPSALPSNLLSEVNTVPRPQWVSDDKAPQCKICSTPFTLLFRRHHCRGCGNVVCALCSDKEVPLPKLGYIHPVRVCKNCYENRELVEIKTTSDSSAVKVAAANFTKSVSDGLSKGTDFLYTQFFSAVARSTALTPAEITEIARSTQLSESEVSAHHLTFQEYKSPTGEYELHSYRYVLGPFGYSQPVNGPDVVEWLYATLHHSFYQGTSTEPKGVPFKDYIATMGTLLRGSEESRARLGYLTVYIADQLSQTPRDQRRITAPSYVLDKRKYPRRETARLPQSVPLNDMRVSVDHVTAVLFGVVEWLRALKINMDRRHERIEAALALLQPITAPITYQLYMRDKLYIKLVHALLYGKSRAAPRNTSAPGGHVVFPGHPHFNVMLSLMFAMQLAVDSAETNRPIVSSDFSEKRSDQTPYWPATNPLQLATDQNGDPVAPFTFYNVKIFTPTVWRAIRNKFGISETDLISSIGLEGMIWPWLLAGEWHGWSQQGSYGKSGSMFFYSSDGQFLLKTISASEAETLREMLAKYYDHVTTGPTLLTPFLGLVQLKDNKSKEHHFLVMRSVFTTAQQITCSYDLKGSVAGRITAEKDRKPGAPMKDLDFDRVIELHPALHQRLISTMTRDAKFLEAQGVMDYSLLLGITRQSPQSRDVQLSDGGWPAVSGEEVYYMGIIDYLVKFTAIKLLESTFKSFKYARHEISALPPNEYAERFLTFMQSIFKVR